jgi:hypothetical protein
MKRWSTPRPGKRDGSHMIAFSTHMFTQEHTCSYKNYVEYVLFSMRNCHPRTNIFNYTVCTAAAH